MNIYIYVYNSGWTIMNYPIFWNYPKYGAQNIQMNANLCLGDWNPKAAVARAHARQRIRPGGGNLVLTRAHGASRSPWARDLRSDLAAA